MEIKKLEDRFYAKSSGEVLKNLNSSAKGLDDGEVVSRIKKYGFNEIPGQKAINPLIILLKQFNSFFVYILILVGVLSFFIGNLIDVYVISGVILVNAGIGFF